MKKRTLSPLTKMRLKEKAFKLKQALKSIQKKVKTRKKSKGLFSW